MGGDSPDIPSPLGHTLDKWVTDAGDYRHALRDGKGRSLGPATAIARAVAEKGRPAPILYRGVGSMSNNALADPSRAGGLNYLASLKPGSEVDLNIASWTSDRDVARGFAATTAEPRYLLRIEDGGRGLDIGGHSLMDQKEWITDGHFQVVSVRDDPKGAMMVWGSHTDHPSAPQYGHATVVTLRQTDVFDAPASFAGSKAAKVGRRAWESARFVPELEDLLDDRMVAPPPVTKRDVSDEPRDDHGMWTDGGGSGWSDPGEKPPGGLPKNFDSLTSDQQMEHFHATRVEREKWEGAISRGVALGKISPEDANARGWNPPNGSNSVAPLPDTLYHATVASDAVLANGLKSQDELAAMGNTNRGLGGGDSTTISLTTDRAYADRIAETMVESHNVATGQITTEDLVARAQAGGFVEGNEGLAHLYETTQGQGAYANLLAGETRVSSWSKDFPGGMVASEDDVKRAYGDLGWHPDPTGGHVRGGDGTDRYTSWLRPSTSDEAQADRFTAYRAFLLSQSAHGGPTDPVFWNPDPKYYASLDPSQIGVVEAHPIPGAMGYPVPAEAEWRTWTGDAVTVAAVKLARTGITKFNPNHDEHGRFAESDGAPTLDDDEQNAMAHYLLYMSVNEPLRAGREPGWQSLDSLVAKSPPFKEPTSLYRSVSKDELDSIRSGSRWSTRAYVSTAKTEAQATGYNTGGMVRIDVPAGTRAIDVDAVRPQVTMLGPHNTDFVTGEVILPRNSAFDVATEADTTVLTLVPPPTTKRARTITISSGGKKRDDVLNPIVAEVRRRLVALVAEHSNRVVKRDVSDEPRDDHGEWTDGSGGTSGAITPAESRAVSDWVHSYDSMNQIKGNPDGAVARAFASALRKSPSVNQTIYRGVHMNGMTPEMGKAYWTDQIGHTIGIRAPSSTSPTIQVAASYAEPVLFKIVPQDGAARDITWKLKEVGAGRFKEAILAPGRFRVDSVSVEKVKDSFYKPGQTRDAVVVELTDVTQSERDWVTLPPKTVKAASPSRHRLQGTMDDLEMDERVVKFNENHDELGRFAESDGGGGSPEAPMVRLGDAFPTHAPYASGYAEPLSDITIRSGRAVTLSSYGDAVPGGYNGGWVGYDKATGAKLGYLDYQSSQDKDDAVLIAMNETDPQYRGEGLSDALLMRLVAEFPGRNISPGMQTEDGARWWNRVKDSVPHEGR